MEIHWHKATGFVQEDSKETSQQPPIPDDYYLPQCEPDSTIASSHGDEAGVTNDKSMPILPQGKMGSMMDAQHTSYKHADIRSDNDHTSDHQLDAETNDAHTQQLNNPQHGAALTTPGNLQGTESTTT